jgi:hypothetical protein
MATIKNIFKTLLKIISKHIFVCVLLAYTPIPFLDILNFYNEVDPADTSNGEPKEESNNANFYFKLKLIAFGIGVLIICYIIFTNNPEAPAPGQNSQISNLYKMQQDQIMQNRLDNALQTTKKILEIKRNAAK